MPSTAIVRSPAILATALFIPDAVPEYSTFTEFMTAVVSGAMLSASPSPMSVMPGNMVLK